MGFATPAIKKSKTITGKARRITMKKDKNLSGFMLALTIFILKMPAVAEPWELKLTIPNKKEIYLQGENIPLIAEPKNLGQDSDFYWLEKMYGIYVVNTKGDTFVTPGYIAGWQEPLKFTGGEKGHIRPDLEVFRTKDSPYFLPPDNYKVFMKVRTKDKTGENHYMYSEPILFTIVEPDEKNYIAYTEYCKIWYECGKKAERLKSFADKYQYSVYAPRAYDYWLFLGKKVEVEEYINFINKYPDYPKMHSIITSFASAYNKVSKGIGVCEKVKSLKTYTAKAKTKILEEAIDEWLKKNNQN